MNRNDILARLNQLALSFNVSKANLDRDANLFAESLLDSLQAIDYMIIIEEEFGIGMTMKIIEDYKLGAISAMAAYIEKQLESK